ncbi:hypothetical protein GOBAR_AA03497 [Gossypium barbadense]|uniref:Uncharacterized protein n=1 Tax=Gossypium barbadense TaxID=3634 RepID=A0A2P5YNA6_GOSBA|nr:hypothetical protein GOBAR_AA03497 [Gossypium barbadense]
MGYVLRVRLASFFTGAATASFLGLYILYKDYKVAHESIAQQADTKPSNNCTAYIVNIASLKCYLEDLLVKRLHEPLDRRISALESLKQGETSQHVEATE